MNRIENISEIKNYSIALYREHCGVLQTVGTGLLLKYQERNLLISAFHVIDMEEERIEKENDPDEVGISQDDLESIYVKCGTKFFCVNETVKALVWTAKYDDETKQPRFSDDAEWCACELSFDLVSELTGIGKLFYNLEEFNSIVIPADSEVIISGYPGYAQKNDTEEYRSYMSNLIQNFHNDNDGLFRVQLDRTKAFCNEMGKEVVIPKVQGIGGMSGGGIWYKNINHYIPIGIILKQDPENNFVEGYSIIEILKPYIQN
ncbi:MAG: hypothetical protein K2N27_05680 [Ruminococcus sp.]|nr:hypothetical protein [Ruminococcus sp.]